MRMPFATVGYANRPANGRNGKGTTSSRAATTPHRSRASAPEVSPWRAWAVVLVLSICAASLTLVQAQSAGSTAIRAHRAPRGCVYMKVTFPTTSANVEAPLEFARTPANVDSSVKFMMEGHVDDYSLSSISLGEVAGVKPIWLMLAPLRTTEIRPREREVLLCGLHGVNDSE